MWQTRTVGLICAIVLVVAGLMLATLDRPPFGLGTPYALGAIASAVLALIGVFIFLWTAVTPPEDFTRSASAFVARVPQMLFHSFFTALLVVDIALLVVFLLFAARFGVDPTTTAGRDVQIFGCIATSGLLGAFVRQFQSTLRPRERTDQSDSFVRFWSLVASLVSGLFTSVVLFSLLRAGILKSIEVDTFNIYGVTGVAAVSGYFSENIIRRFSRIYENLFEPEGKRPDQ